MIFILQTTLCVSGTCTAAIEPTPLSYEQLKNILLKRDYSVYSESNRSTCVDRIRM